MKKKVILLRILFATFGLSLILIWGQSCISKADSRESSDAIVELIKPIDELEQGYRSSKGMTYDQLSTYVRKFAHVIEYGAVGFQLMAIMLLKSKKGIKHMINILFIGILIALIDETIQIFSDRGSLVSDIWIDAGGLLLGMLGAWLIGIIACKVSAKKQQKAEASS